MMAAAQAAAEAAMRDAVNRERSSSNNHHQQQQPLQTDMARLLQMQTDRDADQATAAQELFREMMGFGGFQELGEDNVESLLQIMAQHSQVNQASHHEEDYEPEPQLPKNPSVHYMTIAEDGTILEATETITGFPPEALLMTSWYDSVYEDDLPGFVAVRTQFWDNNMPDVECFLRRRTREGEWVWLATKVLSYIDEPVQGVIVEEREVENVERAVQINRIIRVTAILIQAVQSARRAADRKAAVTMSQEAVSNDYAIRNSDRTSLPTQNIPLVAEDALAYQNWFKQAAEQSCMGATIESDPFQALMKVARSGVQTDQVSDDMMSDDPIAALKRELMNGDTSEERKGFDPLSALKEARGDGTRVDLGMVPLSTDEVKMVTLLLTGKLQVEELAHLVHRALSVPGESLTSVLSRYVTHGEKRALLSHHATHGGRQHASSGRSRKKNRQASLSPPQHGLVGTSGLRDMHKRAFASDAMPSRRGMQSLPSEPRPRLRPAAITGVSLSYTNMGNEGMEMFGEFLYAEGSILETLDVSFCALDERGILSLARSLAKRKRRGVAPLRGLLISGNHISYKAAKDLGTALSPGSSDPVKSRKRNKLFGKSSSTGYEEDYESDDEDLEEEADDFVGKFGQKRRVGIALEKQVTGRVVHDIGLQVLHLGSSSLTPEHSINFSRAWGRIVRSRS
ncbi:hypothetical protein MHU86_19992 [Fragilaria crotonensis]|nr:hypothetical protein MHU86_19992 [Fragilaria crotonensis]